MTGGVKSRSAEEVAMAHRYRWRLLYCLFTYTTPMRLPDIAHQLTVWNGDDHEDGFLKEQLIVYNTLYHDHLPVLREAALVDYHQQNDTVDLGSAAERVRPAIEQRMSAEFPELLQAEQTTFDTASGTTHIDNQ